MGPFIKLKNVLIINYVLYWEKKIDFLLVTHYLSKMTAILSRNRLWLVSYIFFIYQPKIWQKTKNNIPGSLPPNPTRSTDLQISSFSKDKLRLVSVNIQNFRIIGELREILVGAYLKLIYCKTSVSCTVS